MVYHRMAVNILTAFAKKLRLSLPIGMVLNGTAQNKVSTSDTVLCFLLQFSTNLCRTTQKQNSCNSQHLYKLKTMFCSEYNACSA